MKFIKLWPDNSFFSSFFTTIFCILFNIPSVCILYIYFSCPNYLYNSPFLVKYLLNLDVWYRCALHWPGLPDLPHPAPQLKLSVATRRFAGPRCSVGLLWAGLLIRPEWLVPTRLQTGTARFIIPYLAFYSVMRKR